MWCQTTTAAASVYIVRQRVYNNTQKLCTANFTKIGLQYFHPPVFFKFRIHFYQVFHSHVTETFFHLFYVCCQTQSTHTPCSRPGSPCFQPWRVRNDMETASPAACYVPGACRSITVWTAARVTVGVRWFVRGRGVTGCWQESFRGVMAVVTPLSLGFTLVLAGSCDGLTRLSTSPTRTNDQEKQSNNPAS